MTEPNKIILATETDLVDNSAREHIGIVERKQERINERTKKHTRKLQELEKRIKELENLSKS